jgi:hypothetical protein
MRFEGGEGRSRSCFKRSGVLAATAVTQEGLKDGGWRDEIILSWLAIVLRSNLGNLEIGTSVSAWKTATVKVGNGKYTEKIW